MPSAAEPIEIHPFDPRSASRAEWAALHAYRRQRGAEDFPDIPLLADADFEHETQRQLPLQVQHRFLAMQGGEILGNMILAVRRAGTPRFEDIKPGLAGRRAPFEAAHRGAVTKLWLWIALAVFGAIISVVTFVVSGGAAIVLWWGPVVVGIVMAIRTVPEVGRTRRALDAVR